MPQDDVVEGIGELEWIRVQVEPAAEASLEQHGAFDEATRRPERPIVGVDVADVNLALAHAARFGNQLRAPLVEVHADAAPGQFEGGTDAREAATQDRNIVRHAVYEDVARRVVTVTGHYAITGPALPLRGAFPLY